MITSRTTRGLARRWSQALACSAALLSFTPWAAAQNAPGAPGGQGNVGGQIGVELYDRPDFSGMRLTLDAAAADLAAYGLGARVSSVVVTRGQWEFCTQPQFRGSCITVGPGRYNRLPPALNDNLASLRPIAGAPVPPPQPPMPPPPQPPQPPQPRGPELGGPAAIVLFAGDFSGPELRLFDAVSNLRDRAFNDTATTIEVRGGAWELCSAGGFGGDCLRFGPGRHALPPALRDRLSSLRPVTVAGPDRPDRPGRPGGPGGPQTRPWAGATPAIVFFEGRDFGGRQLPIVGATPNFGEMDFNDRASSVEVFRGRWQLCRHVEFGGDCIVVGPGRYTLDGRLHDAVSSARPLFGRDDRQMKSDGALTLHDQLDFRGRSLPVDSTIVNLRDLEFNDRAMAIEVHGGQWELCSSSNHRGRCFVFGPGWHRLPEGLAGDLTSLRPR